MICPITQCTIEHPAITVFGNVYEASAIKEWLKDNITDPLTNQVLPVSYLFEPKQSASPIEDLAKTYSENARTWCSFLCTINWYKQQNPIEMKALRGTTKNDFAIERIKTEKSYNYYFNQGKEEYKLPIGVLMTCLSIRQDHGNAFKSMDVIAADMKGCTFINCTFHHCNFSFSDISDCLFIGCVFSGNTCFYDTDTNERTAFIQCSCEETWCWKTYSDEENVFRLLRQRGLHHLTIDRLR